MAGCLSTIATAAATAVATTIVDGGMLIPVDGIVPGAGTAISRLLLI